MTNSTKSGRRIMSGLLSTRVSESKKSEGISDVAPCSEREQGVAPNPLGLSHPAKTPMPSALRTPQRRTADALGLSHPAKTPMPAALRSAVDSPVVGSGSGARRLVGAKSAYAVRAERKGQLIGLVEILVSVRDGVREGKTLLDGVATGTLWGWRARITLSSVLDVPLADWDNAPGRTQLERLAVVERALAECGLVETTRRGGWAVSSSSKR